MFTLESWPYSAGMKKNEHCSCPSLFNIVLRKVSDFLHWMMKSFWFSALNDEKFLIFCTEWWKVSHFLHWMMKSFWFFALDGNKKGFRLSFYAPWIEQKTSYLFYILDIYYVQSTKICLLCSNYRHFKIFYNNIIIVFNDKGLILL